MGQENCWVVFRYSLFKSMEQGKMYLHVGLGTAIWWEDRSMATEFISENEARNIASAYTGKDKTAFGIEVAKRRK